MHTRHPIDRLADLRKQKAEIDNEIEAIRLLAIDGTIDLIGDEYRAELKEFNQRIIPLDRAEQLLDSQTFQQLLKEFRQIQVRLKPLT